MNDKRYKVEGHVFECEGNMLISWSDDYSLGIEEIDNQHRQMVVNINSLENAYQLSENSSTAEQVFTEFLSNAHYHLRYEEAALKQAGYPGLYYHKTENDIFLCQIHLLHSRFSGYEQKLPAESLEYLGSWMINHMRITHKEYFSYLAGNK